ncbi:MAG: hypothetical protein A3B68_07640 [Candidatus Melainabacteria bacterium RIFCSPHIGHO2_02_FULL_34_12]|nr:MAG: hypothetical protein A3B68_07640 [Candidatus Melainabacteria bacterium RIFCSPHIGHO2_02_FULL_34_12]
MKEFFTLCFTFFLFSISLAAHSEANKEIDAYTAKVREKISTNWINQKPENVRALKDTKDSVVVKFLFEIKKDGSIQNLKIIESSKIKEINEKALSAVKLSIPFPPLPKKLDILTIVYGFRFEPPLALKKNEEKQVPPPDKETYKKELDDYYKNVVDKIHLNWKKPNVLLVDTTRAIISFSVNRDGSIKDLEVAEGSDFPELDESGLDAVKNSAPFSAIPEKIPYDSVPIKYTFALDTVAVYDVNSPHLTKKEKINIEEDTKKAEKAIKKYHDEIAAKINKGWDPPQDKYFALRNNIVELEFFVLQNGELYRPNITLSSGDWELDQSTIQTIELVAPFPPLPPEIKADRFKFIHKFLLKQNF